MPWCDDCERYLTPTGTGQGGECPSCGRTIAASPDEPGADSRADKAEEELKVPWHFKLLLLATAVYLAWRAIQGVSWLATHV